MKQKIPIIWAGVILLAVLLGVAAWNHWFSATRIAFVNYQATTLGQIARANDHARIRLASVEPSEFDRLGHYDVVLMNGMGLRITAEERAALQRAADRGLTVITTMATNPANEIISADSATLAAVKGYLSGGGRKNYRNLLVTLRRTVDGKRFDTDEPEPPVVRDLRQFYHANPSDSEAEELDFDSVEAYEAFLARHGLLKADAPRVIVTGQMGEPAELIARLEEGKVYRAAQAQQALGHFFSKQNLAALREIALRRTADRLNRTARKQHPEGFLNPSDHILVCLSSAPSNAKVIRTAARMAEAFQGDFTALFVETPDTRELSGENRKRLRANLKLAEDLGARIATVYGDDPATQIADYSRTSGVTKIVLGRTNHRRRRGWWNKKALVDRLTELAPNLDVYIIPDRQPAYRPKWKIAPSELSFSWKDTGKMLGILAAATLLGELFSRLGFGETNIVTVYILGVLLTATWTEGRLYGILSSLLSVLTFNFFFTEPYFSLDAHPSYVITFFIMFLSSFLTSSLTIRIKTQARMAVQKNYSTEVLLEATQLLQQASGEHEVLAIAVSQLGKLLDRPILYYPMDPDGQLMQARIYPETESNLLSRYTGGQEKAVADWVCKNNKHAGAGTHTLPNSRCLYLAVRSHGGPQAVVGIPCDDYPLPEAFEQNLIRGILNQAGIVLEQRLSDLRRADTPFQGDSL